MRILLDVDGVLADFNHPAANLLEQMFPEVKINRDEPWPREWDWITSAVGPEREALFWQTVHENPEWFTQMPMMDDALPLLVNGNLLKLYQLHDVYCVTSRRAHLREATEFWLTAMLGVPFPVICAPGLKGPLAEALKADLLIDDKPEHVQSAIAHGVEARLIARPWNADSPLERHALEELMVPILAVEEYIGS